MLVSLAAAPLLAKPAFAQEADAVDSAVDNLTSVIKVRTAVVGVGWVGAKNCQAMSWAAQPASATQVWGYATAAAAVSVRAGCQFTHKKPGLIRCWSFQVTAAHYNTLQAQACMSVPPG
jgi:hypothetical protein